MRNNEIDHNKNNAKRIYKIGNNSSLLINYNNSVQTTSVNQCDSNQKLNKMDKKSVSVFCSITFYCALVNFVSAKLVPPATIEPLPDLYSFASTYPAANNVNYNASPNPQYSSNNFNNFNEVTPQPLPQIIGSYQNVDYQQKPHQQQKTLVDLATGASTTTTNTYDYSNDLK